MVKVAPEAYEPTNWGPEMTRTLLSDGRVLHVFKTHCMIMETKTEYVVNSEAVMLPMWHWISREDGLRLT